MTSRKRNSVNRFAPFLKQNADMKVVDEERDITVIAEEDKGEPIKLEEG